MDKIIEKLGGRKFFLTLLVFVSSGFLLQNLKIDSVSYMNLTKILLIAYVVGNISQSFLLNKLENNTIVETDPLNDPFGGRKFILVLLMYCNIYVFVYTGLVTGDMYIEFTQWLVGIYITGNIGSKAVENGLNITIGKK